MYDYLDLIVTLTVRQIYRLFQEYRRLKFDELNVIGEVQELYRQLEAVNQAAYEQIAEYYYRQEATGDTALKDLWLAGVLRTPSAVMKYSYESEVVRKRDRLMEALAATGGAVAEYDKAMRYWVQMFGWFAVEVADAAIAQARADSGIDLVMWVSEHDSRVCDHCWSLNGQVFHSKTVPPKPHPNCRCYTVSL